METCKQAIERIALRDEAVETLKSDWIRLAAGLPEKMKKLTENDLNNLRHLANVYCQSLLDNLHDRFSQPEVLSAYRLLPHKIEIALEWHSLIFFWTNLAQ